MELMITSPSSDPKGYCYYYPNFHREERKEHQKIKSPCRNLVEEQG